MKRVLAVLILGLFTVGILPTVALAAAPACAATGPDPTKQAIHPNKKGVPKKLKEPENPGKLFGKGRPNRQREDQERNTGEVVRIAGFSTALTGAEYVQSVSQFEDAGYVKLTVKVCNRNSDPQSFSYINWRLQTPSGQVLDPTFVTAPILGGTGGLTDIVKGAEVAGDVYFQVGGEHGEFYALYKPEPFDASRGVWKVAV